MSDLKLTDSGVIAEGSYFAIHAASFELKDSDRFNARRSRGHMRRALVHETDDSLVINYGNDYPMGVTIEGPTKMNGDVLFSQKTTVKDLLITDLPFTNYLSPNPRPNRGPFDDPVIRIPPGRRSISFEAPSSLVAIIKELRKEIGELNTKVNALETSARS